MSVYYKVPDIIIQGIKQLSDDELMNMIGMYRRLLGGMTNEMYDALQDEYRFRHAPKVNNDLPDQGKQVNPSS